MSAWVAIAPASAESSLQSLCHIVRRERAHVPVLSSRNVLVYTGAVAATSTKESVLVAR